MKEFEFIQNRTLQDTSHRVGGVKRNNSYVQRSFVSELLLISKTRSPPMKVTACYDEEGIIITNTLMSFELISSVDEMFWLGYLNCAFTSWYAYNLIYDRAIRTMNFYNFYIQQLPIPKAVIENGNLQTPIVIAVKKILAAKKKNPRQKDGGQAETDTSALEKEIDVLVYKQYGLTEEEIRIVEGK